ncbi:unnamed protein product, partial [Scytosiphon promiscuus]
TSTPRLSSSVPASRGSPRGSAGSVEEFCGPGAGMSDMNGGGVLERPMLSRRGSSSGARNGGERATVLHQAGLPGAANRDTHGRYRNIGNDAAADDAEQLPACLVGIMNSFFGGGPGIGNGNGNHVEASDGAPPPRSPSTITRIELEVGRSAFARLGSHGLDDIKNISGAGISAPESRDAVLNSAAARGNAPAEGFGLAAANAFSASSSAPAGALAKAGARRAGVATPALSPASLCSSSPASSCSPPFELSRLRLGGRGSSGGNIPASLAASATSGLTVGGGGVVGPNPLKTVKITGTAEEVQLAEYLIRVRTTERDIAAA